MSHTLQSLLDIKQKLDHLLKEEDVKNNQEGVRDCLHILEKFPMTADLIKQSGLGNVLTTILDKFAHISQAIVHQTQGILKEWKTIRQSTKQQQSQPPNSLPQKSPEGKSVTQSSSSEPSNATKKKLLQESSQMTFKTNNNNHAVEDERQLREEQAANEKRKFGLPQTRRSVVNIFFNIFKNDIPVAKADHISLDIEEAINQLANVETSNKEYVAKAKLLSSSIKMNKTLKEQIQKHQIDFAKLVTLSAAELTSPEIKLQREQLTEIAADSRLLGWYEKHEKEIKETLGLDPNNTEWTYEKGEDELSEPDADPPDI